MDEMKCIDMMFGEMSYRHRWYKKQNIHMFGVEWEITVAAKAYSGRSITKEQQESYSLFMKNEKKYVDIIGEELKEYVDQHLQELAVDWLSARRVGPIEDLSQMVTPKTLLFKQNGDTLMLLDCVWDIENGIGVKVIPEIVTGSQDLFL